MKRLNLLVLATMIILILVLASSLMVRGCPQGRHGYGQASPPAISTAISPH